MFASSHQAQVGISIEPLVSLSHQSPTDAAPSTTVNNFVQFSRNMLQNLFNYVSSYATSQSQMVPTPNETYVPMSCLQKWYQNFERKLQHDPNFWKS